MSDPHRCIAGPACRSGERTPDGRQPGLTINPDTLCDPCRNHFQSACHQLPKDWAELSASLGDRQASAGDYVKSTPTPAIPISTQAQAIMADIVDTLDRAAAIVSDQLKTDQPDARRSTPKAWVRDEDGTRRLVDAPADSVAYNAAATVRPTELERIQAWTRLVEPHIDKLAAAPQQDALKFARPGRCDWHIELITAAEAFGDHDAAAATYRMAGDCDECCGWDPTLGQARELTTYNGLDLALTLVNLHHQTRAHLGKIHLRHKYSMPCPECGGKVGRDDGTTVVDCEDCDRYWTQDEYDLLARWIVDDRNTMETLKYLLAEAYWRLDMLRDGAERIRQDPLLDQPESGRYVLEGIDIILAAGDGHPTPEQRATASDKETAQQRQDLDDTRQWKNETPYIPPKRKTKPKKPPPEGTPVYAASSLSTLVEAPENSTAGRREDACKECNMIHKGDCVA